MKQNNLLHCSIPVKRLDKRQCHLVCKGYRLIKASKSRLAHTTWPFTPGRLLLTIAPFITSHHPCAVPRCRSVTYLEPLDASDISGDGTVHLERLSVDDLAVGDAGVVHSERCKTGGEEASEMVACGCDWP